VEKFIGGGHLNHVGGGWTGEIHFCWGKGKKGGFFSFDDQGGTTEEKRCNGGGLRVWTGRGMYRRGKITLKGGIDFVGEKTVVERRGAVQNSSMKVSGGKSTSFPLR